MIRTVDLHTHSRVSDGQYHPAELVSLAKQKGIQVLALTDHDNIDGVVEASCAGQNLGVQVVPGVELSAKEYNTFHILGYGKFTQDSPLAKLCNRSREGRRGKALRIIDYLAEKGMYITMEEVRAVAGEGSIGRPHFARLMLEKKYISNYRDAFNLYLDTEEYHDCVEIEKPPVRACIEAIKTSGGKVALAHPYQIGIDNDEMDMLVHELVSYGLDAIESYYPKHTPEQTGFYLELTKKYGLYITGGSDFHGERVKPEIELAKLELELDWLLEI